MPGRWGETPFAALLICLIAGIVAASRITHYSYWLAAAGTATMIATAADSLRRNQLNRSLALAVAAVAMGGFLMALAGRDGFPSEDIRARLARNEIQTDAMIPFEGCVADESQRRDGEIVNTVYLQALRLKSRWERTDGRVSLRIPEAGDETAPGESFTLRQGDRMRGWAGWHEPRNFQNPGVSDHAGFLARRGIYLLGRVKSARLIEVIPGGCQDSWNGMVSALRMQVQTTLGQLASRGKNDQAAILAAVVLGDYSNLSSSVREAFQNSGTYHVLVVSGLHVSWIAWVLLGLFRLIGIPNGIGRMSAAAGIFLYSSVVGYQASISRSLWMFLLYLLGKAVFRRAAPANVALASAFLILVSRADWIFDSGFQLSFLSVLAICLMGAPIVDRILNPLFNPAIHAGDETRYFLKTGLWHRLGRKIRHRSELWAEHWGDRWHYRCESVILFGSRCVAKAGAVSAGMMVISLSVQLWLEPLLAYNFNRLSWIAPAANLIVVPLSSCVLAAGLLAAFAASVPVLAPAVLMLAGRSAALLLAAASGISNLPGAWQRCPTPSAICVLAGIAVVSSWCFMEWRQKWVPWAGVGLILACLSTGSVPFGGWMQAFPWRHSDEMEKGLHRNSVLLVSFLDVGEGDAIFLRFPDSQIWVVDSGGIRQGRSRPECERGFDIGEAVVSRFLWYNWITRIDRLVLTHPDLDHAGGMQALLRNFRVSGLEYGELRIDSLQSRIFEAAKERRVPLGSMQAGETRSMSGVTVEIHNPVRGARERSTNEGSVVLRLVYGRFSCLLTGDLEKSGESDLIERTRSLRSLVLKVAHHGSRWATTDPLLEKARPQWAVISAGRSNPFGHPSPDVLKRLSLHGARPLLTLDQGAITFATDGQRYNLATHVAGVIESGVLP